MEHSIGMIEKNIYKLVYSFLLSCIFAFHFGSYIGIHYEGLVCVLAVFAISFMVSLFAFLMEKYKWIIALAVLVAVGVIGTVAGWSEVYDLFVGYVEWMYKGFHVNGQWLRLYSFFSLIGIVIFSYGLQLIMEKNFYVKIIFGMALAGLLVYFLFSKYEASHVGVLFSLSFLVLLAIEWTELKWKKEKQRQGKAYMLWMTLIVSVFFLLMLWMPVSKEPFRWDFVKETVEYYEAKLRLLAYDIFQDVDIYDLSLAGFSEEATLGDGVVGSDKEIMLVTSDRPMRTNLYLSGKYFNTFENMTWLAEQEEDYYDRYMDTLQTSYAVLKYGSEELDLYSLKVSMVVIYQDLNTEYLFVPGKLSEVNNSNRQPIDYIIGDGSIYNPRNLNYGSYYWVDFYQMNSSAQPFVDFLKTPVEQDDELWDVTFSRYERQTDKLFRYEQLEEYAERCYDNYLIEPALSVEARAYLDEVTAGCTSDIEKLLAIEAELSSFAYTKMPGKLPEDVVDDTSFLDYFLFESPKGYCTYYATAFVLLARAEGFPARYVQGYCVPMYGTKQKMVLSSMAHAWPEVYIKDIGWVAFEPTPGYYENGEFFGGTNESTHSGSTYPTNQSNTVSETADSKPTEETAGQGGMSFSQRISWVIKLPFFIIPGGILVLIFITFAAKIIYKRKPAAERYRLKVKRNIKLLGMVSTKMSESETLTEYRRRVEDILGNSIELGFVGDYEEVIYGNKDVSDMLVNCADRQYMELLLFLKKRSYYKYLMYRILKIVRCDVT